MRSALLLALVVPLFAFAQTTTTLPLVIRAADGTDTLPIPTSECGRSITARWAYQATVGTLCTAMKVWATSGSCSETGPGTADTAFDDVPLTSLNTLHADNFPVKVSDLPAFKAGTTTPCGTAGVTVTHKLCGLVEYSTYQCGLTTSQKLLASPLTLLYDTQPPAAPRIDSVVAQDEAATIHFTPDSDTVTIAAEVADSADAGFSSAGQVASTAGLIRVGGLINGTTYWLRLRGIDAAGNQSDPTDAVTATPVRTEGFWGVYRDQGGSDPGGCSSAFGGPGVAALLAWIQWRRRSKR